MIKTFMILVFIHVVRSLLSLWVSLLSGAKCFLKMLDDLFGWIFISSVPDKLESLNKLIAKLSKELNNEENL